MAQAPSQAHGLQQGLGVGGRGRTASDLRGQEHVLERGELGHQLIILEDEADALAEVLARRHEPAARQEEVGFTGVGDVEPTKQLQQRRLARTG